MSSSALKAVATGQTARSKTIIHYLSEPRVASGIGAVAGKFLTADRMLRLCINAVKRTPKLAECDPQTVLGAMMMSAALGLEPNTVQQQAFLIPYKKRAQIGGKWVDVYECQFQIGARGFITLGYRSPHVQSMIAGAIHENDHWKQMDGSQSFLEHSINLRGRGELIGSFSHVKLTSGREVACVLPLDEIWKIRDKSETYRALVRNVETASDAKERRKAEEKLAETPWVMWLDDMASKSATKKHAKQLPIAANDALSVAASLDDKSEAGIIDMAAMANVDAVREVVDNGAEPPALEDIPPQTLDVGTETFGTRERATVHQGAGDPPQGEGDPPPAGAQTKAAQNWEPSEEEKAAIRARELAESREHEPPPAQPSTPPAGAPQARTRRNQVAPE